VSTDVLPAPAAVPLPAEEARARWAALGEAERDEVLLLLEERVVIPRPLMFHVGDSEFDNDAAVEVITGCRGVPVADWTYPQLVLLSTLWLWELGSFAVSELNQSDLSFALLDDFVAAKEAGYRAVLGLPADPEPTPSLFDRVAALGPLRKRIERDHVRCMRINGATWERREWFLPVADVRVDDVPEPVARALAERVGIPLPGGPDARTRFAAYADAMIDAGVNPAEALVALAEHAVRDEALGADYAIITCARGNKLDVPHTIEMKDVLSYTAITAGLEPKERGIRLDRAQIANAICQRMRYNVVCRVRNYSPSRAERMQAQAFQIPDIAVMEDAHHNGHRANGVRFVTRAPIAFDVGGRTLKGLADFRVNRATHDDSRRFTPAELRLIMRTSWWMKTIAETSWARGAWFDEKYCTKLEEYTDKDGAALSRRARILGTR
jgi:hypothetical protein